MKAALAAVALLAAPFVFLASASARTPTARHNTYRTIIILAGQSNALGADSLAVVGKRNYLAPPFTNGADRYSTINWAAQPNPDLLLAPAFSSAHGQVPLDTPQVLTTGAGADFSSNVIFGPEIGWARQIYADLHEPVSVIKDARDGSAIEDWTPSNPHGLFSGLVKMVKSTVAADTARHQVDTIGAVAWYQGESDAEIPEDAASYQANLGAFISDLRSNLPMEPTTPIVLVKESLAAALHARDFCATNDCSAIATGDTEVRAADDWAAANLPHIVEVDSLGLPRTSLRNSFSEVHLSDIGELTLGKEIAKVSEHLMPHPTQTVPLSK